jgi:hypothetical protein
MVAQFKLFEMGAVKIYGPLGSIVKFENGVLTFVY